MEMQACKVRGCDQIAQYRVKYHIQFISAGNKDKGSGITCDTFLIVCDEHAVDDPYKYMNETEWNALQAKMVFDHGLPPLNERSLRVIFEPLHEH